MRRAILATVEESRKEMNIQRAKEEIIHTVRAYTARAEDGNFRIPVQRQRPILLIGPPGIGKTEIVKQAAKICNVGFVAYTMTHHTRQSAVGLPVITKQTYQGQEYEVTRYTMSEIIGSIYDYMEHSGKNEGILFLDEINCVSETLMPTMLQLLQGKKFGEFAVPEGWVIVTAGNPYVYNTSVREFDMVTLDRVKRMEIEPDYTVWRAYARQSRLHGAILFFLDCKKDRFYYTRREGTRMHFVTARGWEDLSQILTEYEELQIPVDEELIIQYLQCESIAHEFFSWYELYRTYGCDFSALRMDEEDPDAELFERVKKAGWEERCCLVQYGFGLIAEKTQAWYEAGQELMQRQERAALLTEWMRRQEVKGQTPIAAIFIEEQKKALEIRQKTMPLQEEEIRMEKKKLGMLDDFYGFCLGRQAVSSEDYEVAAQIWREQQQKKVDLLTTACSSRIRRVLSFLQKAWEKETQDYLQLIEAMTQHEATVFFLHRFPEKLYDTYLSRLILEDETKRLLQEVDALEKNNA